MGTYLVRGGKRIEGEFAVRGSKNAALPILAACVLAADEVVLKICRRFGMFRRPWKSSENWAARSR